MSGYSILQVRLDQTISLAALEEASEAATSIVRADATSMHRDLFGIVVSRLPLAEAEGYQAELKRHGFLTDLVADEEIPSLHEPFTVQRIDLGDGELLFTDMIGREQRRGMADLVFVAGGFLNEKKTKSKVISAPGIFSPRASSGEWQPATNEREYSQHDSRSFRLDFFFTQAPNRLRASVSAETMMFFRGRPLRLRDTALLLGAMMDVRELLPESRLSRGLFAADTQTFYPAFRSYEEEIRWHFYRLKSPA